MTRNEDDGDGEVVKRNEGNDDDIEVCGRW